MSHHDFKQRKIRALIWMFIAFLLVTGAHYFFWKFSWDRMNTDVLYMGLSKGLTSGCVLWTTVLFGAMLRRHGWSRYVMITMMCLSMAGFVTLAIMVRTDSVNPLPQLMKMVVFGTGLYAVALVPLSASSSLRHYLGPKTAGER